MNSNHFLAYLAERYPEVPVVGAVRAYTQELQEGKIAFLPVSDGFAVYGLDGDAVILYDIYIVPEGRKQGASGHAADAVVELGRAAGKRVIIGFNEREGGGDRAPGRKACQSYGLKLAFSTTSEEVYMKGI